MARGLQNQAKQTYGESQGVFKGSNTNASQLYSQLFPQLEQEATDPQGFAPKDLATMNTAAQQSTGGATAGAVGEGNLTAARTRNIGGFAPALDEAVRSGSRQLSSDTLGVQNANAQLKQAQQQAGISGLTNLYGTNTSAMLSALGLQNQSTNAGVNAGNTGWFQNLLGGMNAAANVGKAAASLSGDN